MGGVDRALHALAREPGCDGTLVFLGDEAEGEREEIGVEGGVVAIGVVAVETVCGIEEFFLEDGEGVCFECGEVGGVLFSAEGFAHGGHKVEASQVEGVDDGVDGAKFIAVPFARGPVDDVGSADVLF